MDPDPDPGGPKTYGSDGSGFGSGSAKLIETILRDVPGISASFTRFAATHVIFPSAPLPGADLKGGVFLFNSFLYMNIYLKGPKHEIFGSGFFTLIKPIWIGDLGTSTKN
jgi:hypothetical protein